MSAGSPSSSSQRTPVRTSLALVPLVAVIALVCYGCYFVWQQEDRSVEVEQELATSLSGALESGTLSFDELYGAVSRPASFVDEPDPIGMVPKPDGVNLLQAEAGESPRSVLLTYQGESRAVGWCFRVALHADSVDVRVERYDC